MLNLDTDSHYTEIKIFNVDQLIGFYIIGLLVVSGFRLL